MLFSVFAASEPLINNPAITLTKKNFFTAVSIFFKRDEHIAHMQAHTRRYPLSAPQHIINQLNAIWDAEVLAKTTAAALSMAPRIDNLWSSSINPDGEFQLQTEKNARNTYYTTGGGAGEYPDLDEYAKHGIADIHLDKFVITRRHLADYASLVITWANPYLEENKTNKYNATHKQALKLSLAMAALNGGGMVDSKSQRWKEIIACANFWIKEMPLINARAAQLAVLTNWAGGASVEKFFRLVSVGEKDFVLENKVISQGPTSFERHKWFYFLGGAPGVDHKWKLTINIKGPAIIQLLALAEEVSDESKKTANYGFLKKANEPNCIGIHEDFLEIFCKKLVSSITASAVS